MRRYILLHQSTEGVCGCRTTKNRSSENRWCYNFSNTVLINKNGPLLGICQIHTTKPMALCSWYIRSPKIGHISFYYTISIKVRLHCHVCFSVDIQFVQCTSDEEIFAIRLSFAEISLVPKKVFCLKWRSHSYLLMDIWQTRMWVFY